jgi:uncharacterized protein YecE (DUF72 family)
VALEFRHESWLTDEVYELVEESGWTICLADAPKFDRVVPVLGPFSYVRRHGQTGRDDPCYSDRELSRDAEFMTNLAENGRDVYVYFNNDAEGCAPKNALTLITKIPDRYVANVPAEAGSSNRE